MPYAFMVSHEQGVTSLPVKTKKQTESTRSEWDELFQSLNRSLTKKKERNNVHINELLQ